MTTDLTAEPWRLGIAALAAAYEAGTLDPVTVSEATLTRVAAENDALCAYITVDADGARRQADAARQRRRDGRPRGPLDGVPVALKDNIDVAGLPCTAGTAAFRSRIPVRDAVVAARLRDLGAVLLGKLNMHEAALGGTTDNPAYGRCANPLAPDHTPGGSSGGSAAAVAASLCAAALGTDTMGSVRLPASYCGIYGFKPSHGAIDTTGVVPLSVTLDSVGPLARSIEDLTIVAHALLAPSPRAQAGLAPSAGLTLGRPRQLDDVWLEPAVGAAFARALDRLVAAGVAVVPVDLPAWRPSALRRAGLLISEAEGAAWYEAALGAALPGLSADLVAMLRYPARAGTARVVAAYTHLESVRVDCRRAFAEVDALVLPTTPQVAFPHDAPVPESQADLTALANVAGAPAVTLPLPGDGGLPAGLQPGNLMPAGLQVVGPPGADRWLLAVATWLDRALTRDGG